MHRDIAQAFTYKVENYLQTLNSRFKLSVAKFYYSPDIRVSHGGFYRQADGEGYLIEIAMNFFISNKNTTHRVYEHPSYDSDKIIGGFYTSDYIDGIKMTICHEMAHAFQHFLYNRGFVRESGHGELFKSIYRPLRELFVNHSLPDQCEAESVYKQHLYKIRKLELC